MAEYTPTTEQFRDSLVRLLLRSGGGHLVKDALEEFDAMLTQRDADRDRATIERCAQIAESLYFGGGRVGSANLWGAKQAAAAIRGLLPAPEPEGFGEQNPWESSVLNLRDAEHRAAEPLPLDPDPFQHYLGGRAKTLPDINGWKFQPRPGYELDRTKYEDK